MLEWYWLIGSLTLEIFDHCHRQFNRIVRNGNIFFFHKSDNEMKNFYAEDFNMDVFENIKIELKIVMLLTYTINNEIRIEN